MVEGFMPEEKGKPWSKEIAKCPHCGGGSRMFEQMGSEIKERGLSKDDMNFYYEMKQGALGNQEMIARLPIGGEIPAFAVATDICLDCGCIYAVKLERTNAKKSLAPVQMVPNRAQRRAGMQAGQGFILPHMNNPELS